MEGTPLELIGTAIIILLILSFNFYDNPNDKPEKYE